MQIQKDREEVKIGRALQERGWEAHHLIDIERVWIPKERKEEGKRSGTA